MLPIRNDRLGRLDDRGDELRAFEVQSPKLKVPSSWRRTNQKDWIIVDRKTKRKKREKNLSQETGNHEISALRLLEMLTAKFIEKLEKNGFEPKVQDALKAIQLKLKLARTSEAEKIFWELIDQLRNEELSKKGNHE
jgi:hypothetical protein